ncbi:YcaO-like family protein [Saccharopolyspora shandongensis]|uniref:YcaO-like family protein n=1 Tax=Saccharopolyspora shandongensis TaxID=418495 RepID=UPI0034297CA2
MNGPRLKLRDDAYHVVTDDGVYVLTHRGSTRLDGASIGLWLDRLRPLLDGTRTATELMGAVPQPERKAYLKKLLATLIDAELVREFEHDEPAGVPFLDYFLDSPAGALERFRNEPLALIGSSALVPALRRGAERLGLRHVSTGADLAELGEHTRVIHVPTGATDPAIAEVEAACAGTALIQVLLTGGNAWLTFPAAADDLRLTSALRRHSGLGGDARDAEIPDAAALTVLAGHVLHACLRTATGAGEQPDPRKLLSIRLDTLATSEHDVAAHPCELAAHAEGEEEFTARIRDLIRAEPIPPETFSQRSKPLVDKEFGLLTEISEGVLAQVPVGVAQATVADPVGLLGELPVVSGAGEQFAGVRYQTALRALARYGASMVDPRRLLAADGAPWTAREDWAGAHLWGHSLAEGRTVLVRAEEAFPVLRGVGSGRMPAGVAAGYDWAEAVTTGLLDHCRAIAAACPGEHRQVELDPEMLDEPCARYAELLDHLPEPVGVVDVSDSLGVPTFALRLGDRTAAYGCGLSVSDALTDGLRQVMLAFQAQSNDQPSYAPPQYPQLRCSGTPEPLENRAPLDLSGLVDQVVRSGRMPVVVPLDHDRCAYEVLPHIVNVVMSRCP